MTDKHMIERNRAEAGWVITARWHLDEGQPISQGPSEVLLRLADDADPRTRVRGMTSGIMRRIERHLVEMQEEVRGKQQAHHLSGISARALKETLSAMPESPREQPDAYYGGLLATFKRLEEAGVGEPINWLAERLKLPKNTVRTQLATARRRQRQG
ncbi:hypothetical protein [Micromonospora sp. NPDC007230]|uniref:hypothetical protein n=1 Tax=Micromonospora sp. NPDC007230 TaxID=3364237 RepID=UPI00369C3C70